MKVIKSYSLSYERCIYVISFWMGKRTIVRRRHRRRRRPRRRWQHLQQSGKTYYPIVLPLQCTCSGIHNTRGQIYFNPKVNAILSATHSLSPIPMPRSLPLSSSPPNWLCCFFLSFLFISRRCFVHRVLSAL